MNVVIELIESGQIDKLRATLVVDGVLMEGTIVAFERAALYELEFTAKPIPDLEPTASMAKGLDPDVFALIDAHIMTNCLNYHLPVIYLRRSAVSLFSGFSQDAQAID